MITVAVLHIKDLHLKVFSTHPETNDAKEQWFKLFIMYINKLGKVSAVDKLNLLVNHIDATVYKLISETPVYNDAINPCTSSKCNICKVCFKDM